MLFCCGLGGNRSKGSPRSSKFDEKGFRDNVQDLGRAYRHRSIELIKTCQTLSVASTQKFEQDLKLTNALKQCDAAIERAVHQSRKDPSPESDSLFEMAMRELNDYAQRFHESHRKRISEKLKAAVAEDQNPRRKRSHALIDVEFHILSTHPCEEPIIVKQKLSDSSGNSVLPEILWNFSHFEAKDKRRLCLAQNPHFYIDLPKSPTAYGREFKRQPTEIYRGTIYVLANNLDPKSGDSRRVFLEVDGRTRAFDNFWDINNTLIFKDVTGRLESEMHVGRPIPRKPKPSFEYHVGRTKSMPPPDQDPEYTPDWRKPIRHLLEEEFSHTHVRIKAV